MQVTYMHSKMKGARVMIVGLVISLQRRSSQGGSATKTTAWWQLRPAMEEDHPVGFRNCSRSPQFFSLQSSVSAIKLSCGYRPAFTTVLIVNVVSRPVFRYKKNGETAIKITPPGRRGSGLAHADSDMVYRTCLCAEMAPLNPFKNHLTAPGWLIALRTCADTEAK